MDKYGPVDIRKRIRQWADGGISSGMFSKIPTPIEDLDAGILRVLKRCDSGIIEYDRQNEDQVVTYRLRTDELGHFGTLELSRESSETSGILYSPEPLGSDQDLRSKRRVHRRMALQAILNRLADDPIWEDKIWIVTPPEPGPDATYEDWFAYNKTMKNEFKIEIGLKEIAEKVALAHSTIREYHARWEQEGKDIQ